MVEDSCLIRLNQMGVVKRVEDKMVVVKMVGVKMVEDSWS